jgi:hypothetical protein
VDTALARYGPGIKVFQRHGDKMIFQHTYAVLALNVAVAYRKYKQGSHARDSVNRYLNMALKVALETHLSSVISASYGIMSEYEVKKGNFRKAESRFIYGQVARQAESVVKRKKKKKKKEAH